MHHTDAEQVAIENAVIDRMADVLLNRTAGNGACTEGDLLAAGFTQAQIHRHRAAAIATATHRLTITD